MPRDFSHPFRDYPSYPDEPMPEHLKHIEVQVGCFLEDRISVGLALSYGDDEGVVPLADLIISTYEAFMWDHPEDIAAEIRGLENLQLSISRAIDSLRAKASTA